jgi:hypothetical protein
MAKCSSAGTFGRGLNKVLAAALALALSLVQVPAVAGAKELASNQTIAAGTYTVTANLCMPGEYNPVLVGTNVYVNNPNNPFTDKAGNKPVLDGGSGEGVEAVAPTTAMSNNATVAVAADGTKTLTLDLPNPVFTLQELGTCSDLPNVKAETKKPADASVWNYGKYETRISRITVTLPKDVSNEEATYTFKGSKLYAVPLNMDIAPTGDVALELTVDLSSLPVVTKVNAPVAATGLVSNGSEQTGVAAGEGYTLSGTTKATAAGTYTATATLKSGYVWSDGTSAAKTIEWSIAAAGSDPEPTPTPDPAPTPDPTPDVTVVKVDTPVGQSLLYDGTEQTGVAAGEGYTLSGTAKATEAGDYIAMATLKDGYAWSDGTTAAKTISWKITKFPDVAYDDPACEWYVKGVNFCAGRGLITGYGSGDKAGCFGVGDTLTRAQLAVILWRNADPEAADAYDGSAPNDTNMSDVNAADWYTGAANWAVANEVINGSDDADGRHFNPDKPVTMEQLAVILANYADKIGAEAADLSALDAFSDAGSISDWARGSVAWAKQKGLVNGYESADGTRTLSPQEHVSRERVATVLMNAFNEGILK